MLQFVSNSTATLVPLPLRSEPDHAAAKEAAETHPSYAQKCSTLPGCMWQSVKLVWVLIAVSMLASGLAVVLLPALGDALRPHFQSGGILGPSEQSPPPAQRPGEILAAEGLRKKHPMVFIPGITSTGLEVWQGHECLRSHFRERIWGGTLMLRKLLLHNSCWIQHMLLNETTGLDPHGVRLRPAMGIGAADVLMGAYSLWGTLVRSLADLGYDANSIHMAAYDWRLGPWDLERRDRYCTNLKLSIELMYEVNGRQGAVIAVHSMGANLLQYFLHWVHSPLAYGIGESVPCSAGLVTHGTFQGKPCDALEVRSGWWAEKYIHSIAFVASPLLGVPKSVASLFSGETRESLALPPVLRAVKDTLLSDKDIRRLFRACGSVATMLPLGGDRVWGKPAAGALASAHGAPHALTAQCACRGGGLQDSSSPPPDDEDTDGSNMAAPSWHDDVCHEACASSNNALAAVGPDGEAAGLPVEQGATPWAQVPHDVLAPDQEVGLTDMGSMITVHLRDYAPDTADSTSLAATRATLLRVALQVQNETRGVVMRVQDMFSVGNGSTPTTPQHMQDTSEAEINATVSDIANCMHLLDGEVEKTTACKRLKEVISTVPKDCAKYVLNAAHHESSLAGYDSDTFNATAALIACRDRLLQSKIAGLPMPIDGHLYDVNATLFRVLPLDGPVPGPSVPLADSAHEEGSIKSRQELSAGALHQVAPGVWSTVDGSYVQRNNTAYYSVEAVLRLMAAQAPRFMHKVLSNVAVSAWRPPTQAELVDMIEAESRNNGTGYAPDTWLTSQVNVSEFSQHIPGVLRHSMGVAAGALPQSYWLNPLAAPLPNAPSMKFFSLYGVGQRAERSYHYEGVRAAPDTSWATAMTHPREVDVYGLREMNKHGAMGVDESPSGYGLPSQVYMPLHVHSGLEADDAGVQNGVAQVAGDSTVPLMSMAYMCLRGWRHPGRNPAGIKCVAREYSTNKSTEAPPGVSGPTPATASSGAGAAAAAGSASGATGAAASTFAAWLSGLRKGLKLPSKMLESTRSMLADMQSASLSAASTALQQLAYAVAEEGLLRGGLDLMRAGSAEAGDHVDVLLNKRLLEDILRIAAGQGDELSNRVGRRTEAVVNRLEARLSAEE